jgi:hypothetical protein
MHTGRTRYCSRQKSTIRELNVDVRSTITSVYVENIAKNGV